MGNFNYRFRRAIASCGAWAREFQQALNHKKLLKVEAHKLYSRLTIEGGCRTSSRKWLTTILWKRFMK